MPGKAPKKSGQYAKKKKNNNSTSSTARVEAPEALEPPEPIAVQNEENDSDIEVIEHRRFGVPQSPRSDLPEIVNPEPNRRPGPSDLLRYRRELALVRARVAQQPEQPWQYDLPAVPLPPGTVLPEIMIANTRLVGCEIRDMILVNCTLIGCKFVNSKHYRV